MPARYMSNQLGIIALHYIIPAGQGSFIGQRKQFLLLEPSTFTGEFSEIGEEADGDSQGTNRNRNQ